MADETHTEPTRAMPAEPAETPAIDPWTAPRPPRSERSPYRPRIDVFVVALVVLGILKALLARSLVLDASWLSAGFALEAAAIILVIALADALSPRRTVVIDLFIYAALSLVMLANVIYVAVFGQIADPGMLAMAGQTGAVADSVFSMFRPVHALFVVDIPLLAALAVVMRRRPVARFRRRTVAVVALCAAGILAVQVVSVRALPAQIDGPSVARARGWAAYQVALLAPRRSSEIAMASVRDAAPAANGPALTPGQRVQTQIDGIRQAGTGTRIAPFEPGAFAGKNVIVVQFESLNGYVVGKSYQGQPITPNLDKLIATSWYFPNAYSETGPGNTADAEFIANTSLLPPLGRPASTTYSAHEIPSLPRLLGQQGYQTITLHTNYVSFWNRGEMYKALGFGRYYDHAYFKDEDKLWHASDQVLFARGTRVLRSAAASSPVYAQFVTMTSHSPFRYPATARRPVKVTEKDSHSTVGHYIGAISYSDAALGEFIAELKASGLYDNSVLVVYGDHTAIPKKTMTSADKRLLAGLLGRQFNDADLQRVGLIVHVPGQTEPQRPTATLGTVDIMPTIADLVGLDLSGTPHIGKSAFSGAGGLVPTRDYIPAGGFVNDTVLFEPQLSFDDGHALSVGDGAPAVATDAERADFKRAAALSALSDAWLNSLPRRADASDGNDAIIPGPIDGAGQ